MRKKKKKKKQILPKIEEIEVFRSKSTDNPSYKTIRRSEDTQTLKQNCKKVLNVKEKQKKQILPRIEEIEVFKSKSTDNHNHKTVRRSENTHRTPWEPCGFESLTLTMTIESAERSRLLVLGKFKFYLVSRSKSTENPSYEAVRYEYGEAQITKDKFWNVNGTMTNKLKQYPSWSFNHSSPNVYERPGCCVDTSKNDYLGNVLIVQRPEDTHRDGPGINQSETKAVMAQRLTNQLSKPTRKKQTITTTKPPGSRLCKPNHQD